MQISTADQVITHFGIYQRPGDTALLIPYLEPFKERYGLKNLNDHVVVADAGYGSEQNYEYMEKEEITGYVKYNYFHMEQKKKFRNNIFLAQNLSYNPEGDLLSVLRGNGWILFTGKRINRIWDMNQNLPCIKPVNVRNVR